MAFEPVVAQGKPGPKDDAQIAALLDQHILFTTGYYDSVLVKERTRVLEYYDGTLPLPMSRGSSKYVSQDVFEEIESLKATILEVFSTNNQIVSFPSTGPNDWEASRLATKFVEHIVFNQNPGFDVLDDTLTDGFLARVGVTKYSWEEKFVEEETAIGPATMDALSVHPDIADENTEVNSVDDHEDGTYTANITKKHKKGYVALTCIPPEDFGITSRAKDIKNAKLCYERSAMTKSELLKEWPEKRHMILNDLQPDGSEFILDQEKAARFGMLDTQRVLTDDTQDLEQNSTYSVYRCYARLDIEGTGVEKLWYVVKCGNYIIEKKKVAYAPFAAFIPLRKAHSFYGNSFGQKVVPIQNAKSVLMRTILDHSVTAAVPRYQVVKGGLMNPKELMDNRFGGIVNVNRPDAVTALVQPPLNPFVFQTLQLLDTTKEDVDGVSKLSKGLNRDAISTQNSQGLVEDLVALSDRRQKIIARRFSRFLMDLYLGIYGLLQDHMDYVEQFEMDGKWTPVDPSTWTDRAVAKAEITVGYGEMDRQAAELMQVDGYLANPRFQMMYTPQNQYYVAVKALEMKGYTDAAKILTPPTQWKPPPPNPEVMAKVALEQAQAKAAQAQSQLEMAKLQFEEKKWAQELALKKEVELNRATLAADAQSLKERAEAHKEHIDAAEVTLQNKELNMTPTVSATAMTKPNG